MRSLGNSGWIYRWSKKKHVQQKPNGRRCREQRFVAEQNFFAYFIECNLQFFLINTEKFWSVVIITVTLLLNLNWIVLFWWGGHCCPMHCDLFEIYCAPPNLGIIRMWICRLNFAQRPIFQAWVSLTSLKSQTQDPQPKVPAGGLVLRIITSWKNPSTSVGFEPVNLGSRREHVTPRPPTPTEFKLINVQIFPQLLHSMFKTMVSVSFPSILIQINWLF